MTWILFGKSDAVTVLMEMSYWHDRFFGFICVSHEINCEVVHPSMEMGGIQDWIVSSNNCTHLPFCLPVSLLCLISEPFLNQVFPLYQGVRQPASKDHRMITLGLTRHCRVLEARRDLL